MELKFSLCSIFVYFCAINSISSLQYEHISDCYFNGISYSIAGLDELTYICGNQDNENIVFTDSEKIKCSNQELSQPYLWPGIIDFRNCRFPKLTRNYFEMFFNMHTFNISNVELDTMQMNIFRAAKNVSTLDISHNKLTEIPSLIFFNSIHLKSVDFSNNFIKQIVTMAFEGATNLEILNLTNNQINQLDSETLKLPNLLTLDLSNNTLTKLPEHILDKLIKLKQLNLSCNAFGNFDSKTFSHLIQLEHLHLNENNLTSIELGTFSHQHKLVTLDLSGNKLTKLDFKLFFPIQHDLRSLRLSNNQLKDLNGLRNTLFPQLNLLDIQSNTFSCLYLAKLMESINWEKIHLHLDINLINVHKSNIRGISCDDSEEGQLKETPFMNLDATQITQTCTNFNNDRIVNTTLIFICAALTVNIILFSVAYKNQIYNQLSKHSTLYQRSRESSSNNVVVSLL